MVINIWQVPVYLPYLQPPLTQAIIADAEEQLGVRLPESYLALLREQNGGYVRLTLPDSVHSMIRGIGPHFPTITNVPHWLDPENAQDDEWAPRDGAQLIPFDGDGQWYLCFDYRDGPDPRVALVDRDTESDTPVAASFAEFLTQLRPDPKGNRLLVARPTSIDEVAAALERQLNTRFEPPVSDAHGYPIRRCVVGKPKDSEWVWIYPNDVPRGFVPPTDRRYAEVKDLMPGTGLLLPDHPDAKVIVDCTDGVVQQMRDACRRASFDLINEA